MSFKAVANCLYCILIAGFMLFYQPAFSQNKFIKIEHWVDENLPQLGGNAVMMQLIKMTGIELFIFEFNNLEVGNFLLCIPMINW